MKLSEAVKRSVKLAATIRKYWDTELPKRHPDYPFVNPGEEEVSPPPEQQELEDFLTNLPDDLVYQLGLIMYLGHGGFNARELAERYEALKKKFDSSAELASRIARTSSIEFLQDGLAELSKNGIDADKLPLKRVKVRK